MPSVRKKYTGPRCHHEATDDERRIVLALKKGSPEERRQAGEQLYSIYRPMCNKLATMWVRRITIPGNLTLDREELYQVACAHLCVAAGKYDPDYEGGCCKLSAWIYRGIDGRLRTYITWQLKLARRRIATEEEIARLTKGISKEDPLEEVMRDDWRVYAGYLVPRLLATLNARERMVIDRFYGLDGTPRQTEQQIADAQGVTKSAVWLWRQTALQKLRAVLESAGVDGCNY